MGYMFEGLPIFRRSCLVVQTLNFKFLYHMWEMFSALWKNRVQARIWEGYRDMGQL